MLTIFKVLEGALAHLEDTEGVESQDVHEVEVEVEEQITGRQCASVSFPEHNYMCFTYDDWREGDFIGVRTDQVA